MALAKNLLANRRLMLLAGFVLLLIAAVAVTLALREGPDTRSPESRSPKDSTTAEDTTSAPQPSRTTTPRPSGAAPGVGSSASKSDAPRPTAPVEANVKLAELAALPERAILYVSLPEDGKSASYTITFQPYGWRGAAASDRAQLVAKVLESVPAPETAKPRDLAGKNVILTVSPEQAKAITAGGTYRGTIEVTPQGSDRGSLTLVEVRKAK